MTGAVDWATPRLDQLMKAYGLAWLCCADHLLIVRTLLPHAVMQAMTNIKLRPRQGETQGHERRSIELSDGQILQLEILKALAKADDALPHHPAWKLIRFVTALAADAMGSSVLSAIVSFAGVLHGGGDADVARLYERLHPQGIRHGIREIAEATRNLRLRLGKTLGGLLPAAQQEDTRTVERVNGDLLSQILIQLSECGIAARLPSTEKIYHSDLYSGRRAWTTSVLHACLHPPCLQRVTTQWGRPLMVTPANWRVPDACVQIGGFPEWDPGEPAGVIRVRQGNLMVRQFRDADEILAFIALYETREKLHARRGKRS